ncbi:MAG: Crp/Fnr family transcriptional regulator [Sphingomonadales bacterium]|nr:Crp/Fnr family transcriptional regulator [Sphingomonadales bacterium]
MDKPAVSPWMPVIRKLERRHPLSPVDREALAALPMTVREVKAATYLVREGDQPEHCCILLSGYAHRHKLTKEGSRQIVSIHMAGDMIDLQQVLLSRADHNVQTLTRATVGTVATDCLKNLALARPQIAEAFWRDTLIDASIFREWVLNVGRREAPARIAHLLCEFGTRSEGAGLSDCGRFELPMTQEQLADATGMTPVHVNRTLQYLGAQGLIERKMRSINVVDWQNLKRVAGFQDNYLHEETAASQATGRAPIAQPATG